MMGPAWHSATEGAGGDDCYTSLGYAHPTRRVWATVLLTRTELHRVREQSPPRETDYPALSAPETTLGNTSDVVEVIDTYLYRPLSTPPVAIDPLHSARDRRRRMVRSRVT